MSFLYLLLKYIKVISLFVYNIFYFEVHLTICNAFVNSFFNINKIYLPKNKGASDKAHYLFLNLSAKVVCKTKMQLLG